MAVDYVYDKTKLTDDEITRLKKLRDRNSEYWKDDLFRLDLPKDLGNNFDGKPILSHDIEGAATGNFVYPILYDKSFSSLDNINPDKSSLFSTALIPPATRLLSCRDLALKKEMAIRKKKLNNILINSEQS